MASRAASRVCFLIGLLFCTSASADVRRLTDGSILISGQIAQQDFAFFSSHSKEFEFKSPWVILNSRGGDVDAAIKIGRIIRSADGTTWIKGRCYSSCALIFIAGVNRENLGELGLHRPYFASAPLGREQIERQMPIMRSAVKGYVEEMGITGSFFERMFNTDPSEIDILRDDDTYKIVPRTDPTYDEITISHSAQWHGLTTSEYRKRHLLADSCFIYDSSGLITGLMDPDCRESTLWGLSPVDYRSRRAKADTKCSFSDGQQQLINATPKKDRYSLPFVRQRLTCRLNMMLGK